jgi:hypothetical protein
MHLKAFRVPKLGTRHVRKAKGKDLGVFVDMRRSVAVLSITQTMRTKYFLFAILEPDISLKLNAVILPHFATALRRSSLGTG